ncbi:MAG: PilZ domain-containing protein [Myxococcales bacterium]|nr:PilZ domain-containing protein [Myxococcota bacterium]MDW8283718.1 PilZ domain-containing protein [Myxococcales bacterium]
MGPDRRHELRLPVEICVRHYLSDEPYLGLTRDLSEGGLHLSRIIRPGRRPATWLGRPLQVEFALPGTGELIWAQGEVCYSDRRGPIHGIGVRLTSMANRHWMALRHYVETVRRARLQNLLLRVRQNRALPRVRSGPWI